MISVQEQCKLARQAFVKVGLIDTKKKNQILIDMANRIIADVHAILAANVKDVQTAESNGTEAALIDRLRLNEVRLQGISESIRQIAGLEDPVGQTIQDWTVAHNQLHVQKVRVPIGVIGIIYEARPNVTADAIALTFKTGNAVVLRGSSSAAHSNTAISQSLKSVLKNHGVSSDFVQLLEDTSRESVETFVKMDDYLDLIIPRGGAGLIQNVVQNATVPTVETGVGNCHVFIDKDADIQTAVDIAFNAKTHRPSVCNACETLIIDRSIARDVLDRLVPRLRDAGVKIKGDIQTRAIVAEIEPATESDWQTEFLALTLPIKLVQNIDDAIAHIQKYGTQHTEVIVSQNEESIEKFKRHVDAAAIGVNVSTRFTDGGEFGFGAEIGISTQMLHARGPMGLSELTSYKYIMSGNGLIRQ